MSSITRAADHLTVEQVKEKLQEAKDALHFRRWLIVYNALVAPRKASEIADLLAISTSLVHKVIFLYNREGAKALEAQGPGGRYHEYLSKQEEQTFLAPFFARAEAGELATTKEIHQAFEERVGKPVHAHDGLSPACSSWMAQTYASAAPSQGGSASSGGF